EAASLMTLTHHRGSTLMTLIHHRGRTLMTLIHHRGRTLMTLTHHRGRTLMTLTHHRGRTLMTLTHHRGRTLMNLAHYGGSLSLMLTTCWQEKDVYWESEPSWRTPSLTTIQGGISNVEIIAFRLSSTLCKGRFLSASACQRP
ncbi:hypothetical protein BN871_HI_00020, partial [Paenibacillus sp. P22]